MGKKHLKTLVSAASGIVGVCAIAVVGRNSAFRTFSWLSPETYFVLSFTAIFASIWISEKYVIKPFRDGAIYSKSLDLSSDVKKADKPICNVETFVVHRFFVYLFFGVNFCLAIALAVFQPGNLRDLILWLPVCTVLILGAIYYGRYRILIDGERIEVRLLTGKRIFFLKELSSIQSVPKAYGEDLILFFEGGRKIRLLGLVDGSKKLRDILTRVIQERRTSVDERQ
jgi:hypothetical protein